MEAKWHIGCSGFSYKEWKDVFYPLGLPQRKWFEHYANLFGTVELNVSFYRFPTVAMLQKWYVQSPSNFLFAVKAPQVITHFKQLMNSETLLNDFYNTCREGLKEKQGPLLFQFPPRFSYTEERLNRITTLLYSEVVNVTEFRHSSWWNEKVYTALSKKNIVFCGSSFPGLPDDVIQTADAMYYRFHGVPKLFYSEYSSDVLERITLDIMHKKPKQVFCYFNNTASTAAIRNAQWLLNFIIANAKASH